MCACARVVQSETELETEDRYVFQNESFVSLISKLSLKPVTLVSRPSAAAELGPASIKNDKCGFPVRGHASRRPLQMNDTQGILRSDITSQKAGAAPQHWCQLKVNKGSQQGPC